jgi:hypothetical protein
MMAGTGPEPIPYRWVRGAYVQLFAVVHPAGNVLAAGPAGAGALSIDLAGAVAIPDRGHCRGRSAGTGEGDYLPAGAGAARTRPRLAAHRAGA